MKKPEVAEGAVMLFSGLIFLLTQSHMVESRTTIQDTSSSPIISTTTPTPASSLEDPSSSATSESSESEDICLRCYDKVKAAQNMITTQSNLMSKQKKLIHKKNVRATEAASVGSQKPNVRTHNMIRSNQMRSMLNSTFRMVNNSETIVVSRLRVARSVGYQNKQTNKKDPDLKQLKQEQLQQKNLTCRSLAAVQDCLSELNRECIGNLQYHSLEVFTDQWYGKLNCPYQNNPTIRVFPGLRTFVDEPEKVPVPRPISSEEEVKKRIIAMYPDLRPFGVMLKPTLGYIGPERNRRQHIGAKGFKEPQQEYSKVSLVDVPRVVVPILIVLIIALVGLLSFYLMY